MVFAERLRRAIETIFAPGESAARGQHATASLGVATFGVHSPTLETLLTHADAAMYRAKSAGRNRVVSADAVVPRPEQDTV
jgi:diguanylate cyclase (GGDEF)-like protein